MSIRRELTVVALLAGALASGIALGGPEEGSQTGTAPAGPAESAGVAALPVESVPRTEGAQLSAEEQAYQAGLSAYLAEDVLSAMQVLEPLAQSGYSPALVLLAYIMDKSEENARAVELYRRAAEQGDPAGDMGLAGMYASGEGVERDLNQARSLYEKAAEAGYGPAMVLLAQSYLSGGLGLEVNRDQAVQWLERAASAGYEPAKAELNRLKNG